jgi:hypothetical protein
VVQLTGVWQIAGLPDVLLTRRWQSPRCCSAFRLLPGRWLARPWGWDETWSALAAILPAISTALAAYVGLYAFEQQSKIYGDAARRVLRARRAARRAAVLNRPGIRWRHAAAW